MRIIFRSHGRHWFGDYRVRIMLHPWSYLLYIASEEIKHFSHSCRDETALSMNQAVKKDKLAEA